MSILVNVVNQKMYVSSHADGFVAGSQQFVQFKFNLSSEWDGLMTFAQFRQGTEAYNQYLDEENCVYLPSEIGAGTCTMMLYGSHDTTIGTTNYLTFRIGKNNLVADAESTDISQSLYDQLVTKITKLTSWNGKGIADLGADVQDLQSQVSSEVARAKASEEANAAAIGLKANQLQVDELEVKVERLTNNEVVSGLIDTAVQEEMSNYLNSGLLAQLAIEDGCVTREKLSPDVCASLNQISDNSDRIATLEDTAANQSEDIQDLQDNFSSVHAEISKAIRYDKQSLANTQKQQARQNIGAMGTTADCSLNMNGYNITNVDTISMHNGSPDSYVLIGTDELGQGLPVVVFGVDEQCECDPPVLRNVSDGIEDNDVASVGQVKAVSSIVSWHSNDIRNLQQDIEQVITPDIAHLQDAVEDAVRVTEQSLTYEQKAQARENIDALCDGDLDSVYDHMTDNFVSVSEDNNFFTEEQKANARQNIDAASAEYASVFYVTVTKAEDGTFTADKTFAEVKAAYDSRRSLSLLYNGVALPLFDIDENAINFTRTHTSHHYVVSIKSNNEVDASVNYIDLGQFSNSSEPPEYRYARVGTVQSMIDSSVGDIETALDSIISIQESLIGGESA